MHPLHEMSGYAYSQCVHLVAFTLPFRCVVKTLDVLFRLYAIAQHNRRHRSRLMAKFQYATYTVGTYLNTRAFNTEKHERTVRWRWKKKCRKIENNNVRISEKVKIRWRCFFKTHTTVDDTSEGRQAGGGGIEQSGPTNYIYSKHYRRSMQNR